MCKYYCLSEKVQHIFSTFKKKKKERSDLPTVYVQVLYTLKNKGWRYNSLNYYFKKLIILRENSRSPILKIKYSLYKMHKTKQEEDF